MIKINTEPAKSPYNLLPFWKSGAYITQNATLPPSDITRGNLSDYMQLPLKPGKVLYYLFSRTQEYSSKPVNTPTCVQLVEDSFKQMAEDQQ